MRILLRLSRYTWRHRRLLLLAYLSVLGATIASLAIPRLLGSAIDTVFMAQRGPQWGQLGFLAAAVVGAGLLRGLAGYGQTYFAEAVSQQVAYDVRNAFYDHLQRLSFAYHDREQTGDLMSRATADVEAIRRFVQAGLVRGFFTLLLLVSVSILIFLLDWRLALYSLAFVPLVLWRSMVVMFHMRLSWRAAQVEMGQMTTVLQENLAGQRVVKAFAAEEHEEGKFHYRAQQVARHSYEASRLEAGNSALMTMFYVAATGLVVWAGGRQVMNGALTVGELAQFIFYLGLLAQPVRMTAWIVNAFSRAVPAGERIFAVLDAQSAVQERLQAIALPRVRGHVAFDGVSFGYEAASPVLKGISFEAKAGQLTALVGPPGSGKSTIAHLIPRFYDVTEGRVTIDGSDVRDATLASLRANIGIVQQDVFLFNDTIRENIAYGNADAPQDELERAAKLAQLYDFIVSLPDGYNSWVGERGITLSGGQRQRLAIARTLLLDPPILILDDSTSSVDVETERGIRLAIREVIKGRTTFVIAHRLSTLKDADLILVLDKGRVIQRGTHQELLAQPGLYRRLYELQYRPQEAPETDGLGPQEAVAGWPMQAAPQRAGG